MTALLLLLLLLPACASHERGAVRFVVIGDNRGHADGSPRAVFVEMLDSIARENAAFVVNTGDLIDGYRDNDAEDLRRKWAGYRATIARLPVRTHHAPGNHDIFDSTSAALWDEQLGPRHYAIDTASMRLIVLDCESEPARIDEPQLAWLRRQLETLGERTAFVVVHRPLFPVDGHIGTSLDRHPEERDRLHALLVEHRANIGAVFVGHEHLFDETTRDGVRYVITGGAGAPLYVPAELGGIYHYVVVTHDPARDTTTIDVRRLSDRRGGASVEPPVGIDLLGERLVSVWDPSASLAHSTDAATDGPRALRFAYDATRQRWPVLTIAIDSLLDAPLGDSIAIDVHASAADAPRIAASLSLDAGRERVSAPLRLRAGWNRIALAVADLDTMPRRATASLTLALDSTAGHSSVLVDNLRSLGPGAARTIASWEEPLLWGVWSDRIHADRVRLRDGAEGLRLASPRGAPHGARLYARLEPAWRLDARDTLVIDLRSGERARFGEIILHVGSVGRRYTIPGAPVGAGAMQARFALSALPPAVLARVESLDIALTQPDRSSPAITIVTGVRLVRGGAP